MTKKQKKTALKLSYYIVFGLLCLFVTIASYQLYSYYTHKSNIEKFIGFVSKEEIHGTLDPLVKKYRDNRKNILQGILKDFDPGRYVDETVFKSTDQGRGDWILFQGSDQQSVDYAALYRVKNTPRVVSARKESTSPDQSEQSERLSDDYDTKEKQVAFLMFKKIIDVCKAHCKNYEGYNEIMWNYLFPGIDRKSFGVGKIYIATEDGLFHYPYLPVNNFDFNDRPWWNAANNVKSVDLEYKDGADCNGCEVGLTKIYTDIEAQRQITDLSRTIFFKFDRYGRNYIMSVDIRLAPEGLNLTKNIEYTIIPIPLLLLLLLYLYRRLNILSAPPITRIYKAQRLKKVAVRFNGEAENRIESTSSFSAENIKEDEITIGAGWGTSTPFGLSATGERRHKRGDKVSKLTQVTIRKSFDLTLETTNLKSFELWKVCRPDNEKHTLGIIEVLWQNKKSLNDITFKNVYWHDNTSASYADIIKQLRDHLYSNESDDFLSDQNSPADKGHSAIESLKRNFDFLMDLSVKYEAYNNRLLMFDNHVPVLAPIYSNESITIFATCSIEFLNNLKRQEQLFEILKQRANITRVIIDGERLKFKHFFDDLDDATKDFILSLHGLRIIGFSSALHTTYIHRDFCILSFGDDKCVFYTDMDDPNAQKGWISWRTVDIEFYQAIRDFIESGMVPKQTVSAYLSTEK